MKCPDALDYALQDIDDEDDLEEARKLAKRYFEYGEYVMIELDTVAKTAKVVPC